MPGLRQSRVRMSPLRSFIAANRRTRRAIEARLPTPFTRHLHTLYKYQVAELINRKPGQVVLDIGAGKDCPFLPFVLEPQAHLIIGADCSEHELRLNLGLDLKIVCDAAADRLPLEDASVDIVVSRSVVEHIRDNPAFFANCARVLRPGGVLVHTFPCKFTPFSIINQIIPNALARVLLALLQPQWQDECGFVAYYDCCYFSAIRALLDRNDFEDAHFSFRYYQAIYYDFFMPLYFVMVLYDLIMWFLGIRNLACGILVKAARSPGYAGSQREDLPDAS